MKHLYRWAVVCAWGLAMIGLFSLCGCRKQNQKDVLAEKFTYTTLGDGTLKITGFGKGSNQTLSLKVPAHINGKAVTVIGANAFKETWNNDMDSLDPHSNIVLPEGLLKIESNAFYRSSIESIYIPDSVQVVEMDAFRSCFNLRRVSISKTTRLEDDSFRGSVDVTYR